MFATLEATSQLNWEAKDPVVGSPTPSEEDRGNSVGERGGSSSTGRDSVSRCHSGEVIGSFAETGKGGLGNKRAEANRSEWMLGTGHAAQHL